MAGIELRSNAFNDHDIIPAQYSHERGDLSPALEWSNVPDGAAELALICEDPDAPTGTFTHWVVAKMPPRLAGLGEGEDTPEAVIGRNDFGRRGYGGPHPPVGDEPHRYFFRVYAVREPLRLPGEPTGGELREAMAGRELASGTLVGLYAR